MKRSTSAKIQNNKMTGAVLKPLTDVDELMLDFEGRESVYMVGLKNPDNAPVLPNQEEEDSDEDMDDSRTQAYSSIAPVSGKG